MNISDRYQADGKRLAGGMAAVFPCRDMVLERHVAIKVMPGSANQRRVRDELSALLKMRSKHVVQVYDVLRIDTDDLGIVQEFIDGKDLFDKDLAPKTEIDYLKLIWQISAGIADIHDLGVIHRDIKPNNMKVDPEGVVKIFDFGLAREEGPKASTVGFVGTPGFAAPELYLANPTFTPAVDTYAFGITALYLGLQNLPPELLNRPPIISSKNHFTSIPIKLNSEVIAVLNSCLHADPSKRPLMRDVCKVLARHLLYDRHKALVVFQGKASYLDSQHRSVSLRLPSIGEVDIAYDGHCFKVQRVSGDVFVNNHQVSAGDALPGACVVALGSAELKARRKYITFDLSNPEIVL